MQKQELNILAINPGTKYLGIAVFQGSDLVYWGIKVLKGKWSRRKIRHVEEIVLSLVNQHDVNVLTLKRPDSSRGSENLTRLVTAIERLAKKNKIRVYPYTLKELKSFLAVGMKINKIDIAGLAVARYQFLIHQLEREKRHKHPYFVRMFEAIAAGILAFNRIHH